MQQLIRHTILMSSLAFAAGVSSPAFGQSGDLASYFGFSGMEVLKIDRGAGPIIVADVDGDGRNDLIAVNNFKSRIEVHYQRDRLLEEDEAPSQVNDLPPSRRFRGETISVSHQIFAIAAHDVNGDGLLDFVFAGRPDEVVFVMQSKPGVFEIGRRTRVRGLQANRNGFAIHNVIGDERPELLAIVEGKVRVWTMTGDILEQKQDLAAGEQLVGFWLADYDGDGLTDVAAVTPEDRAPVRLWLAQSEGSMPVLGPQLRFEMPPLREFEPVRLPGRDAALMAVIERASKRIALYELSQQAVEQRGDREAAISVFSFSDPSNRKRDVAVADVDGDGMMDLIATDTQANTLVVYRQVKGRGLQKMAPAPSYAELDYVAAGDVDDDPAGEVFVLSEKEGVVGRSDFTDGALGYPVALPVPDGRTPVAMNLVRLESGSVAAIIVKDGRDYAVQLTKMDGTSETVSIGAASRSPESIVSLDADADGRLDLLLLTRDRPMMMLQATEDGFKLRESKDMGQFGLVQAATSANTGIYDVDGDGREELLIADRNFVRAVHYDPNPPAGVSPGWQVVAQLNASDSQSKLVALAVMGDRIVAADRENGRLVVFAESGDAGSTWRERESLSVRGFTFNDIYAGSFTGDGSDSILAIGDDAFAVIRLAGERYALDEFASWRTDKQQRYQHELFTGDVNNDGFPDMLSLDAGEQMLEIFTFSEAGRMLYATGFQVFESKIFSGGEPREFQPSFGMVADLTGDGANDLILLSHDRVLLYPQMTNRDAR